MKLTLTIESNNDAFEHNHGRTETGYLLRKAAALVESELKDAGTLRDVNGNTVGSYTFFPNSEG